MVARKQRDRDLSGGLRDQGPKVLCGAMLLLPNFL